MNERAWAATAISNLILNEDVRKDLLNSNLLTTLIHLLSDPSNEVVIEVCGALRNLACVGGESVCMDLLNAGILNTLILLFQKLEKHFNHVKLNQESKEMDIKSTFLFSEQLVSLIWSLVEVSNDALVRCTGLLPLMQELIFYSESPFSTKYVAAQCIMTVCEDNPDIIQGINKAQFEQIISDSKANNVLRLLAIGILFNVGSREPNPSYLKIIQDVLSMNVSEIILKAQKSASLMCEKDELPKQDISKEEMELKKSLDKNYTVLDSQLSHLTHLQLALEILSMLFYDLNEGKDKNDMDTDSEDSIMNEINPYAQEFLRMDLLKSMLDMLSIDIQIKDQENMTPFMEEFTILKMRICGALNNLFCCLVKEQENNSNVQVLILIWRQVMSCMSLKSMERELQCDFIEMVWSLVRIMGISWISLTEIPSCMEFVDEIIQLFHSSSQNDLVRLSCIGVLGFFAQSQGMIPLNEVYKPCHHLF